MPDSPLLQHPRNRFVAFSAVGVAMVCLPLWQVLRYQQSELHQLAAQRALLDPVSQAVHVQFGLLAHRQVSGRLLQGQPQLEPARQAVQVGVDEQLHTLGQQLAQGLWFNAVAEARDLKRDWQLLAQRVKARALTAAQSDEDHTLRVEQALQVLDLVTLVDAVSTAGPGTKGSGMRLAEAARLLSRLAAEMPHHSPAVALQPQAAQAGLQVTAARLLRSLQAVEGALKDGMNKLPADSPMAAALAAVDHSTQRVLQLHGGGGGKDGTAGSGIAGETLQAQRDAALQQAHQAQRALFDLVQAQHKRVLAQRQGQLQQQQTVLLAAMAFLSALALALAAGLMRQLRPAPLPQAPQPLGPGSEGRTEPGAADAAAAAAAPTLQKLETGRLLSRLRTARELPSTHRETAPQDRQQRQAPQDQPGPQDPKMGQQPQQPQQPQDTLPPDRR